MWVLLGYEYQAPRTGCRS